MHYCKSCTIRAVNKPGWNQTQHAAENKEMEIRGFLLLSLYIHL